MYMCLLLIATVLYDRNFQILEFYMKGRDEAGQERMKIKFADMWRYSTLDYIHLTEYDFHDSFYFGDRFLLTKSCRRKAILHYFGEETNDDTSCHTLGGELCDNCTSDQTELAPREQDFAIIADAITDLPNHGITKVS